MVLSSTTTRTALIWAVPAAVFCGAGIATQARINGALGAQLDDGFVAAVISFGSGLLILAFAMLLWKPGRTGLATVRRAIADNEIPWWYACGGAAGGLLVLSQGLSSAALGVALFSIGVVSGQTISGVLVDRAGIGTMTPRPITLQRVLGALLALVAVALAGSTELHGGTALWLYLLPFVSGLGIAWQQAVNGQIKRLAGSILTATFVNFVVGTAVLCLALAIHTSIAGWPEALPSNPLLYVGGAVGITFIAIGAVVVGVTGVLLLSLGTISGQLLMSLVLDLALPVAGHEVHWTTYAGIALALCAVAIVALSARASKSARQPSDASRA
jgi:transporter family-2 protein